MAGQPDPAMDSEALELLEDGLRKTMLSVSGAELDAALAELGWADMLSDMPEQAIPLVFQLLGETGSHASILNDIVVLQTRGRELGQIPELPYAGGGWVVWDYTSGTNTTLGGLPLHRVDEGDPVRLVDARRAVGWWLVGASRAMLALARQHALDRVQFGRPIAGFQAIRHRLAETLVAIEGAEATLTLPGDDNPDLTAMLAKAAAGKAALTTARNCQQVLGGIGFTEEHDLHRHVKRILVLDQLLGSSRELTRRAGAGLRARGSAPRLAVL
jgi:hypothetical protein